MSVLAVPTGPDAVRAYRFTNAELDAVVFNDGAGEKLVKWLTRNGTGWDAFWTNSYGRDAQAVAGMMREMGIPVVVDVDDYFDGVQPGNAAFSSWQGQRKYLYRQMLEGADRKVASTPFLAERYGCEVATNFVVPRQWDWPRRPRTDDSVVLLHCGSVNRAEDYMAQEAAFRAFLELPHTKVLFMGWLPKWAADYPVGRVVFCRWVEYEKYQRMMRWLAPDIIASPLEHNDFNRAKSNLKWLEAGMCGAAFVGERWGEYERTVADGVTGVLADGEREWTEALIGLALDPERRQYVAEAGRAEVLKSWTWDAVAPQWRKAVLGED